MADLEGVRGVQANLLLGQDYFDDDFHGEFYKKLSKIVKMNPPW